MTQASQLMELRKADSSPMNLSGKTGLIFGVANDRSYATYIAQALMAGGARCAFSHLPGPKNERRTRKAIEAVAGSFEQSADDLWFAPCDAYTDADLDAVFERFGNDFEQLDFIVHSIAFADREWLRPGTFHLTPRKAYLSAIDISAYTLAAMAQRAKPLMERTTAEKTSPGGSIVAMSYYGAEKVIPGYNVMGVAKAALECTSRYLAAELGTSNIRVNTVSGGALKTLASSAVGGIDTMLDVAAKYAPLRRNVEGADVGNAAAFLLSDAAAGITGQNLYVDCGVSIIGGAV